MDMTNLRKAEAIEATHRQRIEAEQDELADKLVGMTRTKDVEGEVAGAADETDEVPGHQDVMKKHFQPVVRRMLRSVHRLGRKELIAAQDEDVEGTMEKFYQSVEDRADLSRATTPGDRSEAEGDDDVEVVVSADESDDESDGSEVFDKLIDDGEQGLSSVEEGDEEGDNEGQE